MEGDRSSDPDVNLRARQRLHAEVWPGGVCEEREGVLLVRLPGAPHLQSAIAAEDAPDPFATARRWYGSETFTLWLPGEGDVPPGAEVVEEIVAMAMAMPAAAAADVELDVRAVTDPVIREGFVGLAAAGFGLGRPTLDRLFPPALFAAPGAAGWVGFVDSEAVVACWSLRTGSVLGLYGVVTAAASRRRGLARALVARVAEDSDRLVLHTSDAVEAFARMGFEPVSRYRVVAPPFC